MAGTGFFSDVGNAFKKVGNVAQDVGKFAVKNRKAIYGVLPPKVGTVANILENNIPNASSTLDRWSGNDADERLRKVRKAIRARQLSKRGQGAKRKSKPKSGGSKRKAKSTRRKSKK